jgi:hypothetical protein
METNREDIILVIGSSTMRAMELIQDPRIRTCIKSASTFACFNDLNNLVTISVDRFLRRYTSDDSYRVIACLVYFGHHSKHGDGAGLMAVYNQMFTQLENGASPCYKSVVHRCGEGVVAMCLMLRKYLTKSQPISLMCPLPASYSDTYLVDYMLKYNVIPTDAGSCREWAVTLVRQMGGNMWLPMQHINNHVRKCVAKHTDDNIQCFDLWTELTGNRAVIQGQMAVLDVYSNTAITGNDISCHLNYEALIPLMLRQFSKQTAVCLNCNIDQLNSSRASYEIERRKRPHKQPDFKTKKCLKTHMEPIRFMSGGMLGGEVYVDV